MRRRFSRRKRPSGGGDGGAVIDAERWLARLVEEGIVSAASLTPLADDAAQGVPADYAALGSGETESGTRVLVGFSPHAAGDALLGVLALAGRLAADDDFSGEALAVAPQWSGSAMRRLGLLKDLPFALRAVVAPSLAPSGAEVEAERAESTAVLPPATVAGQLADPAERELFARAAVALEGLASKHGGATRGIGRSVELVLLARRVAELRAEDGNSALVTMEPQRTSVPLTADSLSGALDTLEGQLRKRLNDRRVRDGEEGLRTRALSLLGAAGELRDVLGWPLGGSEPDVLDSVGVDSSGRIVVGAVRERLDLGDLGAILDAFVVLQPALPLLLANAKAPVVWDAPRLALAAREIDPNVARVLTQLTTGHDLFEIRSSRGRGLELAPLSTGEAAMAPAWTRSQPEARGGDKEAAESEGDGDKPRGRSRRRGRRSRGRGGEGRGGDARGGDGRGGEPRDASVRGAEGESGGGGRRQRRSSRFDEVSLFDLEDEVQPKADADSDETPSGRRRDRGRSRRRGRRGGGDSSEARPSSGPDRERPAAEKTSEPDDASVDLEVDDDEFEETLAELPEDVPDFDAPPEEPRYDDDDEGAEEPDPESERLALEREKRRLARQAAAAAEPAPKPRPPRRRAAVVAHADRDSLLAAILLARDIRLLEGIWVYPQSELMTFFRSVATDLRDETPIHLVGFTPSPARDVIQAAGLYRDRITWFDHHDWPPEDLGALRESLGSEAVHVRPGTGSSLLAVLPTCSRRSRFSDKLVDLATGRFTEHDYERWGRLWWHRLGELTKTAGECRASLEALLAGRPSDLAREAARVALPPLPEEVAYVGGRDFRLVHFAGYSLVVVEVPEPLDLNLTARIARERYAAPLSLAMGEGSPVAVLAGDEAAGRRPLDLGSMIDHLAAKYAWIEALPDVDHVARFRIEGLASRPERLDDVVGEIAMGRSILER